MTAMRRSLAVLAAGVALALAPAALATDRETGQEAPAAGPMPRALASNGAVVAMPPVESLGCQEMGEALRMLDRSRYRGPAPVPERHPDRPIFEYEHRLAAAYYFGCMHGHELDDPGSAFLRGFGAP